MVAADEMVKRILMILIGMAGNFVFKPPAVYIVRKVNGDNLTVSVLTPIRRPVATLQIGGSDGSRICTLVLNQTLCHLEPVSKKFKL